MHNFACLRRVRRDVGFTLTELVIAMLVVGVLASIALPSFLGSRNNSYDKEAQASIELVLRAASALYSSQGDFSDAGSAGCGTDAAAGVSLAADLQKLQPNVDVVGGSVTSSNSRVVSVDARPTFNSNGEKLGCQAFYATVFSSSGSCFVARLTFEGKFLGSGSVSPAVVNSQTNTSNSAVVTWSALAANGQAFGVLKPQSSAADGDNTNSMASIQTACKAKTQSTGAASLSTNYIAPSQFYVSWRDAVAAPAQPRTYAVGETGPGGGIVFYVSATNFTSIGSDCGTACRYLESSTSDQSTSIVWATTAAFCYATDSNSGTSDCQANWIYPLAAAKTSGLGQCWMCTTPIGVGMENTKQIYARLTTAGSVSTSNYAAGIAWAYSNNGKDDWHLPSRDELSQLYAQRSTVGGFAGGIVFYWTSTEAAPNGAFAVGFHDGSDGGSLLRSQNAYVRAVRAFG